MVEGINMASFLKQMEELEKLKKKAQVAPKLQTHKGVSSGTPSSLPRAIDNLPKANASQKAGMAAEKATRVFLQNSPDAYLPRPQQVGPSQWKGPTNTKNIGSIPGMSAAKRAASAAERASMAYQNAFLPTPKKQNTYGPQKWNGGAEELSAYNPFKKGPSVFETAMNNAKNMEQPATPTEARSGGGLFNRVYNAASSIGDSMIGADKSLKATAKQAFNNEKEYRKTLAELDSDINAYMAERDKYAPGSKEYKAINTVINNLYNAIDDLRNKAADMTDANEFMRSAEKLRNEATKGLSGLGLDLAEAGISMADNLTTMALTGFNPTATLALMGAKSAGQRANQLSNQGVSARDALGRGVISGVIEGLTEKIGLDNLFGLVKSNNIKALSSILKQAAAEGGEEGLSNILNYAVDWASGDRKDFDWDDFARSVRQGALSGLGFGIGGVASNTVLPRATGYSDMGHLNMERAIDGKRYGEILPRAVKKYSSDVSGVNVNIGSETVQNYINRIQKPINANEINSSIKIDMSETEREPILKNMSIKVSDATRKAVPAEITDKINSGKLNEAYKAIKAFAKSLGVFKQYENENIDIKFNFSGESYNKSKSEHMIRKNNVNDFLLMVNDFDNIIQNAIPIEIHSDRINGGALKNVRVLVSAFWNGKEVVPVEIEVKEYNQQENEPKLYMAVTINKKGNAVFAGSSLQSMHALALPYGDTVFVGSPKMGPQTLASPSESDAVMDNSTKIAPLAVSSPSTISLPDLIKGVNGNNGDFLKYFPDSMLDDEQIAYKNAALEKERVKYENKNKKSDSLPADGLQLSAVEATSDPIFNIPQSFENNKFADANTSFYKSEVGEQAKQENEKIYHGVIKARTDIFTRGILDNFNKARKFFIDYAKNNFKPQYINKETGKSIDVGRNGLDKVLSGNITYEKYASVFHIPELIENATYIGKADNYHTERPDRQNSVKTYSYYESPISIDGKMYIAYIRVRNTLMGDKYYGHTIGEILDRIKIEPLETRAFAEKSEIQSVNEVSSDSKNIIPQTSENINNSAPKELGKRQVMPSVKTLNPAQIAKISEEDMNTTPPINRVNQQYKGNAESRFKKSMQSQTVYSDEFKKRAAENVNINTYDSMSNKEAFSMAQARLDENGAMETERWKNMNPYEATTVDRAEGMILAKRYEQEGNYEGMITVVEQLRKMATAAGQSTQIFSALQRMTPDGMAYYAQKSLDNAREEMVKGKTQKWIDENESRFHLTPEETAFIHENMAKIGKASSQREKDILLAEIQSMISEKLPSTTGEKMRTLARISMLFNAKTQIRNVLGNVIVMPRALLSDAIGSGIDKAVSGKTGMRTTGTFKASSLKGVPHGISEAFYDYRHGINTRNVQNDRFDLGTTSAFKGKNILSKGVKKIDDLTSFMLDAGDRGFYEMWYENSLANQMALNNVSEPTQAMEDLAAVEAAQRTWQDDNGYTSFVSDVKRGLNRLNFKGYGLGDIVMPFVKTPANLVKAVVDYSPVGVVKALMKDSRNLNLAINTGKGVAAAQRAYVNDLSKGITGTLLLIFYGFLADKGIIKGDASEDKDVRNFERNILGMLPYSVKIGDKTYSYEWAQPVGGTAAVAANAVEGYKTSRQQGGTGLASVTNALYSGVRAMGTTLFNLSFLEGLKNFFNSGDPVKGITESVGAELSKFLPTALGQVAQTMDEYNRTTYVYGNPLRTNINKALLKMPGARETLPAAVDVLGRKVKGHNSVADAFINPVNYGEENTLPTADEIYSLYKETGNKSVIPPTAPYTVTYKGNTVTLSPEQTAQYQTVTGTIINKSVENLTKNSDYQHMRADEKVEVLNDIYAYAQEKAKDGVISIYELSNTSKEADEAAEHGLSEADYFFYKYYLNRKDEDKKKMSNEQKRDKLKNNKYLTVREKELLDDLLIDDGIYMPKEKNVDYGNHESFKITQMSDSAQEKWTIFKNAGMSADEYSKVYPIAAGNGKKADKIAKLQSMGYSYNDAVWIYKQATKKKK